MTSCRWRGVDGYSTGRARAGLRRAQGLAKLGYLTARLEPGKTRQRTVYTLTDKGLEALNQSARTPIRFTPVKSELLLRLLIADLVGEETTRESISTIRDDISELFARLEESKTRAKTLPHADEVPAARLWLSRPTP